MVRRLGFTTRFTAEVSPTQTQGCNSSSEAMYGKTSRLARSHLRPALPARNRLNDLAIVRFHETRLRRKIAAHLAESRTVQPPGRTKSMAFPAWARLEADRRRVTRLPLRGQLRRPLRLR